MTEGAFHAVGRVFLVRHGQSTFNAHNTFTGLSDPELTERGVAEAHSVAGRLKASGVHIDFAFSSGLQRTIRTGEIVLQDLDSPARIHPDIALNERSYGELTGLNKDEAGQRWTADQVSRWRRSYAEPPPGGESLRDVVARVAPYYHLRSILPRALQGGSVLVIGHGNTLRALVTALEGLTPHQVPDLEIATGEIIEYEVASDATVKRAHLLDLPTQEEAL